MIRQIDLVAIFGARGSGKSNLSAYLQTKLPRVLVIDTMAEYDAAEFDFKATSVQELGRIAIAIKTHRPSRWRVLYVSDVRRSLGDESEKIFEISYFLGNHMLVLEEIHSFMKREWLPHWLNVLVTRGRHRGVGIMGTSQRPAMVSKDVVSLCDHIFASRFTLPHDLKFFEGFNPAWRNQIERLPRFKFFHIDKLRASESIYSPPLVKTSGERFYRAPKSDLKN